MTLFTSLIRTIKTYGVLEVLVPFFLIYSIIFALLQKIKIFGDPEKATYVTPTNVVISVCISLIVTFYTPFGISLIEIFSKLFTTSFFVVLMLAMFAFVTNLIALSRGEQKPLSYSTLGVGFLIILYIAFSANLIQVPRTIIFSKSVIVVLSIIGVIIILVWFIALR